MLRSVNCFMPGLRAGSRYLATTSLARPNIYASGVRFMGTRPMSTTAIDPEDQKVGSGDLLVAVSELDRDFDIRLRNFPNVTVTGPQSSGKTSLIEAICGRSIFPKKMDMATKKPFNILTIRSDQRKFKIRDRTVYSEAEAADLLMRLNDNTSVRAIDVEIHDPGVYNALLTDLPGLFYVSGEDPDMPQRVLDMNKEHIEKPNNIPVVVSSAANDPATNQAIQLVSQLGRRNDAMGVLTKLDLTKNQSTEKVRKMLAGELRDYHVGHGWFGCILRNKKENDMGMTVAEKEVLEKKWIEQHPNFAPCGVDAIRRRISDVQLERIKDNIPAMVEEVEARLEDLKQSGSFLTKIVHNPKERLAGRLKDMIESIVDTSPDRVDFEEKLRHAFHSQICEYLGAAISRENGTYVPDYSQSSYIERSIMKYQSGKVSKPSMYANDGFGDLFRYGLSSPMVADQDAIVKAYDAETCLATSLAIIQPVKDDPLNKKRRQWNRFLRSFHNALLRDGSVQDMVYTTTKTLLLDYLREMNDGDDLSHKFAEYCVNEIGQKTFDETIRGSITSTINAAKRPNVTLIEVVRELTKMYPQPFTFEGGMLESYTRNNKKLNLEVYSEDFNEAYLKAEACGLSDEVYRIVAVNWLDNMVRDLLEMTIEMFNPENVEKETQRVNGKIQKLSNIRDILKSV